MKRVTFFIGNGFDLNLGLETKYKDFYNYYWLRSPGRKLPQEIQKDYQNWADLELGLGKYTEKVKVNEVDMFLDEEDHLEQLLAAYLIDQCKRIKLDDADLRGKIALQMKNHLMNFYKGLNIEQKNNINKCFATTKESIHYSFINFNYTDTLERILEVTKEFETSDMGNHKADTGSNFTHSIGVQIHIHGTTTEEMVVGVNDETQIANKELCKNSFFKELLLKPEANRRYGQNKIATTKRIIDESMIICVFGMSLGETDKMWWEYLCKWLAGYPGRRLIIYVKKEDNFARTKKNLFFNEDIVFGKMKSYATELGDRWDIIRNQIYIEFNSEIFTFEKMV